MSYINGMDVLREATDKLQIDLCSLIASTSLWVDPVVYANMIAQKGNAIWFENTRRMKKGEVRRSIIEGIVLDDNSRANRAIKSALGIRGARDFAACHVWPTTCYDARYHTNIANIFLVPSPLASLTDYDPEVMKVLQFRSYDLYGWFPLGESPPIKPASYPTTWRPHLAPLARGKSAIISRYHPGGNDTAKDESAGKIDINRRIEMWARKPLINVHRILAMILKEPDGIDYFRLLEALRQQIGSINPEGTIASLMTSKGRAYGDVLIKSGNKVQIKPELIEVCNRYDWHD